MAEAKFYAVSVGLTPVKPDLKIRIGFHCNRIDIATSATLRFTLH
jgi:hypothetical protein